MVAGPVGGVAVVSALAGMLVKGAHVKKLTINKIGVWLGAAALWGPVDKLLTNRRTALK